MKRMEDPRIIERKLGRLLFIAFVFASLCWWAREQRRCDRRGGVLVRGEWTWACVAEAPR